MASEAECAYVVIGDDELLYGESAADRERDAAEAVQGMESEYKTGVVTGPHGVGDGVECKGGDGLAVGWDRYRWPIHDGSSVK